MLPIQSLAISDNTTEHSHTPCHLIWKIFNRHDYYKGSSLRKDCNRRLYIHQVQWLGELNKERQGGERDKREAQQIIHKSVGTPTSCDHVELSSFPPLFLIPTLLPSLHIIPMVFVLHHAPLRLVVSRVRTPATVSLVSLTLFCTVYSIQRNISTDLRRWQIHCLSSSIGEPPSSLIPTHLTWPTNRRRHDTIRCRQWWTTITQHNNDKFW